MREYERLQVFRDHLEALLVSTSEARALVYHRDDEGPPRRVHCTASDNEELVLSLPHTNLTPAEKERLHSFPEFSGAQVGEDAYRLSLGKDPRRAATLVDLVFTRVIGAPENYDVDVETEPPEEPER